MAESKSEKAQRLIDDGGVTPIAVHANVGVYAVKGDTRAYIVTVLDEPARVRAGQLDVAPGSCDCEARGVCSHILAAHGSHKATVGGA